jgi:hypothetical protein
MANILTTLKKWFGGTVKSKGKKGRNSKGQFVDGAFVNKSEKYEVAYAPKRKTRPHKHPKTGWRKPK